MKRLFVILCFFGLCTAGFCGGNADTSSEPGSSAGPDAAPAAGTIDSSRSLEQQLQQARQERRKLQQRLEQEKRQRAKLEKDLGAVRQEREKLERELDRLASREEELLKALERQYFQAILPGIYGGMSPGYKGLSIGAALGMYESGAVVPYIHTLFGINPYVYFAADGLGIYNDGAFNRALAKEHCLIRFGKESAFSLALHNSNVFNLDDTVSTGGSASGELKFYGHFGSNMDILLSAGVPYIYLYPDEDREVQDRVGFAGLLKPSFYIMDGLFSLSGMLAYNTLDFSAYTMNELDMGGLFYGFNINFNLYKGWVFACEYLGNFGSTWTERGEFTVSVSAKTGNLFLWGRLPYGNIRTGGEKALTPSLGVELRF